MRVSRIPPYSIDPVGSISVIDTAAYLLATPAAPSQANVQTIDFSAWNNRKAELSNRGIRITGKAGVTTTLAQDIEPEAIAITADGKTAYISLQENNGIAVLDISTATPAITSIFSAGIQDWDRGTASAKNYSYTLSYAAGERKPPQLAFRLAAFPACSLLAPKRSAPQHSTSITR